MLHQCHGHNTPCPCYTTSSNPEVARRSVRVILRVLISRVSGWGDGVMASEGEPIAAKSMPASRAFERPTNAHSGKLCP